MATTSTLVQEKLDQAVEILREQEIDLWLTFVRETMLTSDPCLDLIAGVYSAWTGAFIVSATGERIAIVGRFDAPSVEQVGGYEVIGYDESIKPALLARRRAPRPALDRAQLLDQRPGRRRADARALARAAGDVRRHAVRTAIPLLGEARQRVAWPQVGS